MFSLLTLIFKDIEIKSHKYWKRHIRVKKRLSRLLVEDESRLSYMRNYLKYGSCECLTKVIKVKLLFSCHVKASTFALLWLPVTSLRLSELP